MLQPSLYDGTTHHIKVSVVSRHPRLSHRKVPVFVLLLHHHIQILFWSLLLPSSERNCLLDHRNHIQSQVTAPYGYWLRLVLLTRLCFSQVYCFLPVFRSCHTDRDQYGHLLDQFPLLSYFILK